jgi:Acyltransferase
MNEPFRTFGQKFTRKLISKTLEQPTRDFDSGGWDDIRKTLPDYLVQLGVKPKFTREGSPEFKEMRRRLNTESGLIICNHPSMAETPTILSTLERDDVKIVVGERIYESSKHLPSDTFSRHFISAGNHREFLKSILNHIEAGGVVIIYPTGGESNNKKRHNGKICFEPGLRFVLKRLKPEQMVYCFNVNSQDADSLAERYPAIGLASELLLHPTLNMNTIRDPQVVRMSEAYTQVGEWQSILEGSAKEDADQALTDKYQSMFIANR